MRKIFLLMAAITIGIAQASDQPFSPYHPARGYIPDQETAIAVAVAVWKPIFGAATIEHEKPYSATLKDGVWHVEGSLPEGFVGGVANADISKDYGTILSVYHTK